MIRDAIRALAKALCPSGYRKLAAWRAARHDRRHWNERIADVLASPDNARIHRVTDAGKIVDGFQIMHNGLQVLVNGYYGDGVTRILAANRGCHEPQEEVIFDAVIRSLPAGAVMIEAGAYWGFYSMWFCQLIRDAKVFLIEPAAENFGIGQRNFQKNGWRGNFTRAYVGAKPGQDADGTRVVNMESFFAEKSLAHVDVLHADVQGFEADLLQGAASLLDRRCVDYLFLSTHSMGLHAGCIELLESHGYRILTSVDLDEAYSFDGVLVACSPLVTPPGFAQPSRKPKKRLAEPAKSKRKLVLQSPFC